MVSSGILFVLGLRACRKNFPFRVFAIPWAYPLSAHGHGSVRPNLMKVHAIFLPSSVAPFTPWVRQPWVEGPIGWRFKVLGMTIQSSDDDSKFWGWRIKGLWVDGFNADAMNCTLAMTGCPEAIMTHDTCHFSIGFFLGSKRRFVFRALPLYISHASFLISPFSAETHYQSATIILVKKRSV